MATRIALVEDSSRYRAMMGRFLRHAPGLTLAASFPDAERALEVAERAAKNRRALGWDLVLMDIELPGINGIEATRRLKRLHPDLKIIALTVFEETGTILQAICAGADGYVLKRARAPELVAAVNAVLAGGAPLTPRVAQGLLQVIRSRWMAEGRDEAGPKRMNLTEREQDVLRSLVEGMSYGQIAEALGIGIGTVRKHVSAIYRKLQVHSAAEAVSRALRERII